MPQIPESANKGLENIIEIPLNNEERVMVEKSADLIRETMKALK